jgi:hypothetical protein
LGSVSASKPKSTQAEAYATKTSPRQQK